MAGYGARPKAGPLQRERNERARAARAVHVRRDGEVRGPELPTADGREWHPHTLRWWQTWRESAQAQLFVDTDWQALMRAALLVDYIWRTQEAGGKVSAASVSEVRLIEERLGATYVDRERAYIKIDPEESADVVPIRSAGESVRERVRKAREAEQAGEE